jgi:hypothetical protein
MTTIATMLSLHVQGDLAYYLLFFLGQCFYLLKRAAMAIRSKNNDVRTRRDFFSMNWDILLVRAALESPFYWMWRHYTLSQLLAVAHVSWTVPFSDAQGGPFSYFILGFSADAILDWVSTWENLPQWARDLIKEDVPTLPVAPPIVDKPKPAA